MRRGFTLVEMLVVLVLIGLVVGLVAPAMRPPEPPVEAPISPLLRAGRTAAVRRGEPTILHVERDGAWRVDGRGATTEGPFAAGRLAPPPRTAFSIVFSPLGTCAADIRSVVADELRIDPLTCEIPVQ